MKPKSLLFAIVFFLPIITLSQSADSILVKKEKQTNFKIGVFGGANFSNISLTENFVDARILIGFNGGMSFQYDFSKRISLESDLNYETKGYQWSYDLYDGQGLFLGKSTYRLSLSYLTIPLLFKYNLGNRIKFSPLIGPYLGILFSGKERNEFITEGIETSINVGENIKAFDYGISSGFSLEIPIKNMGISLDARHGLGLNGLFQNPIFFDGFNRSLSLMLGLKFNLGNGWD